MFKNPKRVEVGCKSRLLFAKIAMAIWFQVSGVKCQLIRFLLLTPDT
jgi:hypothetical protein